MARKERVPRTCIHCNKRRTNKPSGMCGPCENLTKAEGTFDQLKLPNQSDIARRKMELLVRSYNRLVRAGHAPKDIAARWGMEPNNLATKMWQARKKYGFKVEVVQIRTRDGLVTQAMSQAKPRTYRNVHGGGRWGVHRCDCEPCVARCKKTRSELDTARLEARRKEREQAKLNKPS